MPPASPLPRPDEIRRAYYEELPPLRRAALLSWLAFTATFGAVRGITYSIRDQVGPFHDLSAGGEHLHHYLWGIGLLAVVGAGGGSGVAAAGPPSYACPVSTSRSRAANASG